ncbi:uncharacterized protein [Montipora foliosa]|uniref:uncharacterized protein isoform X1 n=2 Tax=Montipora foliosa TaxID=591990 RepID=UPI0035F1D50A
MTKKMRPNHRVDVLTDALLFCARKRAACLVSISREDVAEWANQEAELPTGLHSQVAPSSWTHTYIIYLKMFYDIQAKWEDGCDPEKLQQLYGQMNKLEAMLQQLKQEHGVMQRWKPDDDPFQLARGEANDRQKRACLQKIYAKVVERWFLLSLKAKYAEGHALAKRLSKHITKATKGLNVSVDDYNKTACSTTCSLQHTLEFDYVKDPDSPVCRQGDDLQGSRKEIRISIKRKAAPFGKSLSRDHFAK